MYHSIRSTHRLNDFNLKVWITGQKDWKQTNYQHCWNELAIACKRAQRFLDESFKVKRARNESHLTSYPGPSMETCSRSYLKGHKGSTGVWGNAYQMSHKGF